ncbi:gfo/Idh/MocA family oxidoreductase [Streptomyces sp. uw30]|uniref:Gfo/Idh/MocA family protein n=1 Tax=Streptomyces sp. uw30 TaxID=1828179 RepID=UPI0011CEA6C6|nr:Gfo/Idh/MocA family oxidoreductase [Streptomyces sp. uw30]TXS35558.1 gfo/Idh/MocA family oxidoreductase [Streptomyces sp. uw30]
MTLRFGLFGAGYWAAATHAPALSVAPDAELVGIWSRDREKAEALATVHGVRAFADADRLIAEVDAVSFALAPDAQAALAVRAAQAGRHLLLEKPLALSDADAAAVASAVSAANVASVVFFTNRFAPGGRQAVEEAAGVGGWDGGRATVMFSIFGPGSPYARSAWRRAKGGLWDLGPHVLSLFTPVLGPVDEVSAMEGPQRSMYVSLRHAGGMVSTMALGLDAPPAANGLEIALVGSKGVVNLPVELGSAVPAMAAAISELVQVATATEPSHPCDVAYGRQITNVLAAAEASAASGRVVRCRPELS